MKTISVVQVSKYDQALVQLEVMAFRAESIEHAMAKWALRLARRGGEDRVMGVIIPSPAAVEQAAIMKQLAYIQNNVQVMDMPTFVIGRHQMLHKMLNGSPRWMYFQNKGFKA